MLNRYGYLAVGGLVLAEDFGIPVPGETILLAAAVYAGAGQLNITIVGIIAFLGAVLGDNIGYAIGHFTGRRDQALRDGATALAWTAIDCTTDPAVRTRLLTTA